jgi:FkbM family methyltransferase
MQKYNNYILKLALRGKGYNNYSSNLQKSGELKIINKLSFLGIDVIFDVGANTGMYSLGFLNVTDAKIFAFEPMKKSFDMLIENTKIHGDRIHAFNYALGESDRETLIYFNSESDQLASLSQDVQAIPYIKKNNLNSIKVKVRTLDDVFNELKNSREINSIDIIKIDTEGFEYEVLQGASSLLLTHPPKAIILEFNWHQLTRSQTLYSFSKLLTNYLVFQVLPYGSGICEVQVIKAENNIYAYSNFVFLRKDCVQEFTNSIK